MSIISGPDHERQRERETDRERDTETERDREKTGESIRRYGDDANEKSLMVEDGVHKIGMLKASRDREGVNFQCTEVDLAVESC